MKQPNASTQEGFQVVKFHFFYIEFKVIKVFVAPEPIFPGPQKVLFFSNIESIQFFCGTKARLSCPRNCSRSFVRAPKFLWIRAPKSYGPHLRLWAFTLLRRTALVFGTDVVVKKLRVLVAIPQGIFILIYHIYLHQHMYIIRCIYINVCKQRFFNRPYIHQ